jgi:hypothetical protein
MASHERIAMTSRDALDNGTNEWAAIVVHHFEHE